MEDRTYDYPEEMTGQNDPQDMPAPAEQFDLKKKAYEDAKQGVQDFEKNHPGTVRKVVCATVLGALATAAIDTVIVLTA